MPKGQIKTRSYIVGHGIKPSVYPRGLPRTRGTQRLADICQAAAVLHGRFAGEVNVPARNCDHRKKQAIQTRAARIMCVPITM
jgi:hypothetical protein